MGAISPIERLKTFPLFSQIDPGSWEKLAPFTAPHFYKKGTILFHESQTRHHFLYVLQGWLKLSRVSIEGEEIIVDILTDHHFSGEQYLFQSEMNEYDQVQAISDVAILSFPLSSLKPLIQTDHQLALNFLQATLHKQQALGMEVEHLSIQNAVERLGCFILRLCNLEPGKRNKIRLPIDKSLMAARLGMRPETCSRALEKLSKECHFEIRGEELHWVEADKLTPSVCQHCSKTFPRCKKVTC